MTGRKEVDSDGRGCVCGVEGEEIIISIYYVKKWFQYKKKILRDKENYFNGLYFAILSLMISIL